MSTQFRRFFWHISLYKVQKSNFITKCDGLLLQIASGITKCDRFLYKICHILHSVTDFIPKCVIVITKCVRYYKVWQTLLQNVYVLKSVTAITNWDVTVVSWPMYWGMGWRCDILGWRAVDWSLVSAFVTHLNVFNVLRSSFVRLCCWQDRGRTECTKWQQMP